MTTPTRVDYLEYRGRPKPRYFAHFANAGMQPTGRETIFPTSNRATRRAATTFYRGRNVRITPRRAPFVRSPQQRDSVILRAVARYVRAEALKHGGV